MDVEQQGSAILSANTAAETCVWAVWRPWRTNYTSGIRCLEGIKTKNGRLGIHIWLISRVTKLFPDACGILYSNLLHQFSNLYVSVRLRHSCSRSFCPVQCIMGNGRGQGESLVGGLVWHYCPRLWCCFRVRSKPGGIAGGIVGKQLGVP